MDTTFLVYCLHKSGEDLESAILLLCPDLIKAIDTAKNAEKFGYDFSHTQTLYVAVAEVKPGYIYKKDDFKPFDRSENFPVVFVRFYNDGTVENSWFSKQHGKKYEIQKEVYENKFGEMKVGTKVSFRVENQDEWRGDNEGILIIDNGEFRIKTKRSGILTIDRGYDVYGNTIKPIPVTEPA